MVIGVQETTQKHAEAGIGGSGTPVGVTGSPPQRGRLEARRATTAIVNVASRSQALLEKGQHRRD